MIACQHERRKLCVYFTVTDRFLMTLHSCMCVSGCVDGENFHSLEADWHIYDTNNK
jgi:hypothetical protein